MTRKSYLCFHFLRNWRKRLFLWTLLISSHLNFTTLLEMPILNCLEKNSNARANQSAPKSGRRKFAPNGNASNRLIGLLARLSLFFSNALAYPLTHSLTLFSLTPWRRFRAFEPLVFRLLDSVNQFLTHMLFFWQVLKKWYLLRDFGSFGEENYYGTLSGKILYKNQVNLTKFSKVCAWTWNYLTK